MIGLHVTEKSLKVRHDLINFVNLHGPHTEPTITSGHWRRLAARDEGYTDRGVNHRSFGAFL